MLTVSSISFGRGDNEITPNRMKGIEYMEKVCRSFGIIIFELPIFSIKKEMRL